MNRRTIIMLAVLAVLVPVAIYMNVKTFRGRGPAGQRVVPGAQRGFVPPPAPAVEVQKEVAERKARPFQPIPVNTASFNRLVATGKWGRNPFLTPEEIRRPRKGLAEGPAGERAPTHMPELTVSSILISDGEKVAVINGKFYTVGDMVAASGEEVVAIKPDGVLLERAGSQRLISIRQSEIPLKTR